MPETTYAWAPITKMDEQEDGTLIVYGPAASSDLDRDQQRLNADWLDTAMPEWAQYGNIREQHNPKSAVGVGVGLTKADDGSHHIAAHIVDDGAVKKIKTKVLKGFSVGIKGPKVTLGKADAPGGEIVGGTICEISVVDRPCNPTTLFEIAKADGAGDLNAVDDAQVTEKSDAEAFGLPQELYDRLAAPVKEALANLAAGGATVAAEVAKAEAPEAPPTLVVNVSVQGTATSESELLEDLGKADLSAAGRKKAAASGAAMSDGSYPINTKADLRKAIRAVGRGGADHDKIRKHVITRARALGLESLVPDNWNSDGSLKTNKADEPDDAAAAETVAKAEQVLRDVRALVPALTKADGEDTSGGEDETGDITGAEQAIAVIARLIIAEAESLAQGNLNEAMDISLLLDAVRSLAWFKQREENEQNGNGDMGLADQPDITKTDAPAETPAVEPAPETETPKADEPAGSGPDADAVTKAELAELVKAVAEVKEAAKERETALAAELTKAQQAIEEFRAMPTPGGPALTRTSAQQAEARGSDADRLRAEAAVLMGKSDAAVDPTLRAGYRDRANELLAKADA